MQVTTWATLSKYTIDSIMIWSRWGLTLEGSGEWWRGIWWSAMRGDTPLLIWLLLGVRRGGRGLQASQPDHCYTGTQVTLPLPSHPGLGYVPFLFAGGVQGSSQPLYGPAALAVYVTHSLDWLHPASPVGQPQSPGSIGPASTPAPPPPASPPPTVFPTLS